MAIQIGDPVPDNVREAREVGRSGAGLQLLEAVMVVVPARALMLDARPRPRHVLAHLHEIDVLDTLIADALTAELVLQVEV